MDIHHDYLQTQHMLKKHLLQQNHLDVRTLHREENNPTLSNMLEAKETMEKTARMKTAAHLYGIPSVERSVTDTGENATGNQSIADPPGDAVYFMVDTCIVVVVGP